MTGKTNKKISLLLIPFIFAACKNTDVTSIENDSFHVETVMAEKTSEQEWLKTFGTVIYNKKYDITSLAEGTITDIRIRDGDYVKKGSILMKMRNIQYEIQQTQAENVLNSAEANLDQAKTDYAESRLYAEKKLISLDAARKKYGQKKKNYAAKMENFLKNEELYKVGGITENAYEELRIELENAETELALLENELQMEELGLRDQDLINAGFIPEIDEIKRNDQLIELMLLSAKNRVKIAETDVKNAKGNLRSINRLINELTVTAPADGIIGNIFHENGEHIQQNEKVISIVNLDTAVILTNIQERDMPEIKSDAQVSVAIPSIDYAAETSLSYISPFADSESGNFNVKIDVANADNAIKLGMYADCLIKKNSFQDSYAVPETCIVKKDGGKAFLYELVNGHASMFEIEILKENGGFIYSDTKDIEMKKLINYPPKNMTDGCTAYENS